MFSFDTWGFKDLVSVLLRDTQPMSLISTKKGMFVGFVHMVAINYLSNSLSFQVKCFSSNPTERREHKPLDSRQSAGVEGNFSEAK